MQYHPLISVIAFIKQGFWDSVCPSATVLSNNDKYIPEELMNGCEEWMMQCVPRQPHLYPNVPNGRHACMCVIRLPTVISRYLTLGATASESGTWWPTLKTLGFITHLLWQLEKWIDLHMLHFLLHKRGKQ